MRNCLLLAVSALAIAASPVLAQGKGGDHGGGPGKGGGGRGDAGPGRGNGGPQGNPGRGPDRAAPAPRADRAPAQARPERGPERRADRGPQGRAPEQSRPEPARIARDDRGPPQARPERGPDRRDGARDIFDRPDLRRDARADARIRDAGPAPKGRRAERVRYADNGRYFAGAPAIIEGCPPGLAKRDNGCLPPGQARRIWGNPRPDDNWYGNWDQWRADPRYDYRYSDGYLYQVDSGTNLISAFLPLLGGALFGGNAWPQSYSDYQVPQYYDDYYGYNDGLDYRYADGAVFGVNPGTNQIDGIAALLTGNDWTVGQAMPAGYDFYNVPPEYRGRYADSGDDLYRYSDGYVYRVDPTSRLVEQAIQLLG
ncbi:hypothetical protein M9980_09650 [Sphingomonas donggukensis]|uniref:RcnB family protein n=1 Tax=Sphingomonas donggukensis TaxID=2949093 RepID=A0ABY4TTT4_9SPHN|nr:hypothetical protein [Sphingomonas donggukensis]URW74832.1 hypothetical protein M9980_09650 [Sphingomonas donggukensis]